MAETKEAAKSIETTPEIKIGGKTLFYASGVGISRFVLAGSLDDAKKIAKAAFDPRSVKHVGQAKIRPQKGTPVLVQVPLVKPSLDDKAKDSLTAKKSLAKDMREYERRGGVNYELQHIRG